MLNKTPIYTPRQFIWSTMRPYLRWVVLAFFIVTLATCFGRLKIYLTSEITDSAIALGKSEIALSGLWNLVILYFLTHLGNGLLWRASGFAGMRWVTKVKANINQSLFNYLSKHSVGYFNNRFAGALANKITNVANGFDAIACDTLWSFYPLAIGLLADLWLTYQENYLLSAVLLVWMVFFIAINIGIGLWLKKYYYIAADAGSKLKGKIVDSTGNISTVQHAPGIEYEQKYIGEYIQEAWQKHFRSWYLAEWTLIVNTILIAIFAFAMLGMAIWLYQQNQISVGAVVMIIAIVVSLERSLFFLGNSVTMALRNYGEIEEGIDELLLPYEVKDPSDDQNLLVTKGKIEFLKVSFAYPNQEVFHNLNIQIKAGEKIGLVGLSGAGKSTIVSLLLRQYNLSAGQIKIDDQDISKISQSSLRSQIAYVPQSTELFHRSILDNIRYGNFDRSLEDVQTAAKLAYADEFIERLPKQYETYVGERGVKLSGGQRQRIAIARAFLKDAPILVLDEATSALDSESEAVIQQAIKHLMLNKTVIAIAHRLSTLQMMDRLLVIDQGKIVESGTHAELLAKKGIYARIWEKQVQGFIQED